MSPSTLSRTRFARAGRRAAKANSARPKIRPKPKPKPLRTYSSVSTTTITPTAPRIQRDGRGPVRAPRSSSAPQPRLPRYPAESVRKALPPGQ